MNRDLLLDTQVLVWMAADDPRWHEAIGDALADSGSTVSISTISWFELAIKNRLGKLDIPIAPLRRRLLSTDYLELPISGNHAEQLELLPLHHRDPFDRMLIAQAISEEMTIVATDAAFRQYEGLRIHTP
jgi:PIN domain nuclease of toxin-antitoxin system